MVTKKQESLGIAVHPAFVLGPASDDLKAFFKEQQERGTRLYIMAPMALAEGESTLKALKEKGVFEGFDEGGFGISVRETFFPRSAAVLAYQLGSSQINIYVGANDRFASYRGIPKGSFGVVVGPAGCAVPAFQDWQTLSAFISTPFFQQSVDSIETLRQARTAGIFRLTMEDGGSYILNTRTAGPEVAARVEAEAILLKGMADAGLEVLDPVWQAGNVVLYKGLRGQPISNVSKGDLAALGQLLASLDDNARKLLKLSHVPNARLTLTSYVNALDERWNQIYKATQAGHKEVMLFMMADLEQLRQDNINNFYLVCKREKLNKDRTLPVKERLFAPGFFGLDNCLRGENGALTFLDLSGAGWDDPVKLISDFLRSTHQEYSIHQRLKVLEAFKNSRSWDTNFMKRVYAVSDLIAVEWILEVLSVVLPSERERLRPTHDDDNYLLLVASALSRAQALRSSYEDMKHLCEHDQLLQKNEKINRH